jgi:cell division protein FtsI (penicillin-binding protein 3)
MLGRTDHRGRMALLLVALGVFAVAASLRLAYWQVSRGSELREVALAQLERPTRVPAVRGRILDRNGRILAMTAYRDRLAAYPKLIRPERRAAIVRALVPILDLSPDAQARLMAQLEANGEYITVARELTEGQSQAIRDGLADGSLAALGLEPVAVRVYPNPGGAPGTTLASQVLGFVTVNGRGNYGIEQQYDSYLAGRPKVLAAARDPYGRPLGSSARVLDPGVDGVDIRLTIDARLQLQLEKELYAAWVADDAKRVSGLIMDPESGSILAWASVPGYDANDYVRTWNEDPGAFQDPIVSHAYEPGSVMKMFTAAAALDSGRFKPGRHVSDGYSLSFPPYTIRNADHGSMGRITFRDAIAYSRNIATAKTAARLGRGTARSSHVLYRMWRTLGIGSRTGVDLAGESGGIVRDPAEQPWAPVDLANRSFGQGVSVTQVQLAAGYAPMINGGFRVTPHFLAGVGDRAAFSPEPRRVLGATLAGHLRAILDHVTSAVPWYAEGSLIRGYQVGGKTGTAQIWEAERNRYSRDVFNFSFVGYVGGNEPVAVVALRIEEARATSPTQGQIEINLTSYQLFRRVATDVIGSLDVKRSSDPDAGYPEPLSAADAQLTPDRYAEHVAAKRQGIDLQAAVWERYLPGARDPAPARRDDAQGRRRDRAEDRRDRTKSSTRAERRERDRATDGAGNEAPAVEGEAGAGDGPSDPRDG